MVLLSLPTKWLTMYNLAKNNYHLKPKASNIQTPPAVSQFIFELLKDKIATNGLIFDPCCGAGNLLKPWERADYQSFGKDIPIVLFVPIGFRLNLTLKSKRWLKLTNGTYPPISSLITLPKNIFPGVVFHSEILIFNIKGLKSHYFLPPKSSGLLV